MEYESTMFYLLIPNYMDLRDIPENWKYECVS